MPLPLYSEKKAPVIPDPLMTIKTIIAVAAGKGGVGKSSVTVHLGWALQSLGYHVGILDADLYGPSIRKMMPEDHLPVPDQKEGGLEPARCKGVKIISMAYFRKNQEAAAVRAPIANQFISYFIKNVQWGELDFLLIDFPPGTGDIPLTLSQHALLTGALIVTTPQEVALLDVRKTIALFEQVKVPIMGVVENMSYYCSPQSPEEPLYLFGKGGGERVAQETGYPLLGQIPLDPLIGTCGDEGHSLLSIDYDRHRPATQAFQTLAQEVATRAFSLLKAPSSIDQLWQKNPYTFSIKWRDGKERDFRLSEVQRSCPCANCADQKEPFKVSEEVRATVIQRMGRYGLRIHFTSGCSAGIYSFDDLYSFEAQHV